MSTVQVYITFYVAFPMLQNYEAYFANFGRDFSLWVKVLSFLIAPRCIKF